MVRFSVAQAISMGEDEDERPNKARLWMLRARFKYHDHLRHSCDLRTDFSLAMLLASLLPLPFEEALWVVGVPCWVEGGNLLRAKPGMGDEHLGIACGCNNGRVPLCMHAKCTDLECFLTTLVAAEQESLGKYPVPGSLNETSMVMDFSGCPLQMSRTAVLI